MAAKEAASGRWSLLVSLIYFSANLVFGAACNIIGPTLPNLARNVNITDTGMSQVLLTSGSGALVGSFAGGYTVDRVRGHLVLGSAMFVVAVTCFFFPVARELDVLDLVACFQGMAFTVIQCVTNTLLAWVHGEASLGPWLNLVNAAFGVGGVLAPSLLSMLGMDSYRAIAGASLLVGGACLLTESPIDPEARPGMPQRAARKVEEAGGEALLSPEAVGDSREETDPEDPARNKAEREGEEGGVSPACTAAAVFPVPAERHIPWDIVMAVLFLGFLTVGRPSQLLKSLRH